MTLYILRGFFLLLSASVAALYVLAFQRDKGVEFMQVVEMLSITLGIATIVIIGDVLSKRKKLSAMSGVFLGMMAGMMTAYALSFVVDLAALIMAPDDFANHSSALFKLMQGLKVFIGLVTCYVSISLVVQTKDDFRFVLPYVEFSKQVRGNKPILLDTSVIIDGRIVDILDTKFFQGDLIVPKFVLNELQLIADSPDKLRRARGRRGLDTLQKLQEKPGVVVLINESEPDGANVDQKLVVLANTLQARVMTNDYNLNKIATLRGIDVVNLNDLAKSLRPVVLPGESMRVKVIKPGESSSQGVGYLEDGTMVVVENARHLLGHEIELVVTSMLQTSAGRMIFGRRTTAGDDGHDHGGDGGDTNHHGPNHNGPNHGGPNPPQGGTGTGSGSGTGSGVTNRPQGDKPPGTGSGVTNRPHPPTRR
ncbi:MAG: PIN/TRAM domain-containing protein [Planctomycetota bacterium]|nr:PIN/TRAM domain-containing protein [Planctomycetota bacterium]